MFSFSLLVGRGCGLEKMKGYVYACYLKIQIVIVVPEECEFGAGIHEPRLGIVAGAAMGKFKLVRGWNLNNPGTAEFICV